MTVWFPYAEPSDVPASVDEEFDDVAFTLRAASYAIRASLKTARFAVDSEGKPTDDDVAAAIKDATVALLAFWAETGDATGAGAQSGGGSILSVSLPGGSGTTDARAKQDARDAPAVEEILRSCPGIDWSVMYR
ncbi:hypothetical protein PTQ19_10380 [Microbacterium esteraromaticum]|uniref:hypothetical protein n=1 Tax=Microbacterium esteraromaticum TaxID=57043 RepID=UPI0023680C31|nr:hypothetical protein [Microbacterium esteraromaticum]WDH77928.1 hypothetical protein PTQ19_10380 [Microbacterium esteraromaticum]